MLEPHSEGVVLCVKAAPGSRKNEIRDVTAGMLKVCCTQAPEKGKANRAITEILAKALGMKKSQIVLLAGETDTHKKFLLVGMTEEEVLRKIEVN